MTDIMARALIVVTIIVGAGITTRLLKVWATNGELPARFDLRDIGITPPRPTIVEFTAPYCYECKVVQPTLKAAAIVYDTEFSLVDAKQDPEITAKYGIRSTPTILVVDGNGAVRKAWTGSPDEAELEKALKQTRRVRASA